MIQTLYALLALALVMLLSISMQRSIGRSDQGLQTQQLTGSAGSFALEALDAFANVPFDAVTDPNRPDGGFVVSRSALTSTGAFGAGCSVYANCKDLDDFHGKSYVIVQNGMNYNVAIEVRYVQESQPGVASTSQTLCKEVTLTITGPPQQKIPALSVSRVFSYQRTVTG